MPAQKSQMKDNIESLIARHHRSGSAIYLTVVLGLLIALAALPLVAVEVTSKSRGVLRPTQKISPLTSPVTGRITVANLAEDAPVCAGDTLLAVSTAELTTNRRHLSEQIAERIRLIRDLELLTEAIEGYPALATALYQRDYRDYDQRRTEAKLKLQHAQRQVDRLQQLMETGSVARMELEQAEHEQSMLASQLQQLLDRQQHFWTQELQRNQRELTDLQQQDASLRERADRYVITAPLDGHLTQTAGLQVGSFVNAGQAIAAISPEGRLRVEAYVAPSDIGLLRKGLPVRLQLDAFNYNQWGLARATLSEIATDVTEIEGAAAFRVVCELHDRELRLRNGYVGRLRKGMTLTAHFSLTRRTLFQLLHDKLDDWFNPTFH